MNFDPILRHLKKASLETSQGLERMLKGAGHPVYNRVCETLDYLERARVGFTAEFCELTRGEERINEEWRAVYCEAKNTVRECMCRIEGWNKEGLSEQFKVFSYVIMLTELLKKSCSGDSFSYDLDLKNAQPTLKQDYQRLAEFYKILGERAPAAE